MTLETIAGHFDHNVASLQISIDSDRLFDFRLPRAAFASRFSMYEIVRNFLLRCSRAYWFPMTLPQIHPVVLSLSVPSERRVAIRVTAEAERHLRQGHPWVYDQAIRRQSHGGQPGDLAVVFDKRNRFIAIGLYDPTSSIRVRILQHRRPIPIDAAWLKERLAAAVRLRASLQASQTNGYRLVHGENDGLPGLVIDRYDHTLVLKLYTVAWVTHLHVVLTALAVVSPVAQRVILRLSRNVQQQRRHLHRLTDGMILSGPPLTKTLLFAESGVRVEVDPIHGQKTGVFLDQRENRARVRQLSAHRAVLDAFAYTGGFSVAAAQGGAREVISIDMSRPALEAARRNMALNRTVSSVARVRHELIVGDVSEVLERLGQQRRLFDLVILDPPSFAKARSEVNEALRAYGRLALLALAVLRPGGILVFSCCSGQVSTDAFFSTIHRAAIKAHRSLHELERTGQPLDHPVRFKEGAYLKCLFAVVSTRNRI